MSSSHFSPPFPSFDWTEESSTRWSSDYDGVTSYAQSPPLTTESQHTRLGNQIGGSINSEKRSACDCTRGMTNLLEESEGNHNRVDIRNMPIVIGRVKSTFQHCTRILHCYHCSLLSDHMMLAAVVIGKIASTMETVSQVYMRRQALRSEVNHPGSCWGLSVGEYMVDSEVEWAAVMRALIMIILKRIVYTAECFKNIAKANVREAQISMLHAAEHKARKIAHKLQAGKVGDLGSQTRGL